MSYLGDSALAADADPPLEFHSLKVLVNARREAPSAHILVLSKVEFELHFDEKV